MMLATAVLNQQGAPGGAWSPADLGADLIAWWSALDSADYTLSGANVTAIDDKSGNGNDLTLDSGSGATIGAINGNDSFVFDGDGYVTVGNVTLPQPFTIASVIRNDSVAADSWVMEASGWRLDMRDTEQWRHFAGNNRNLGAHVVSTPYAHVSMFGNPTGGVTLRLDGAFEADNGGTGTGGSTGLMSVGQLLDGSELSTLTITELLVIDGTPAGTDLSNLETYLRGLSGT